MDYIPPFTGVKANPEIDQNINIGFCGSHWSWNDFTQIYSFLSLNPTSEERLAAKKVYLEFHKYPFYTSEELYEKLNITVKNKLYFKDLYNFTTRISGIKRLRYLLEIEELGLEIRGGYWRNPNTPLKAFPELLLAHSDLPVNDFATTQNFYNSAKIGFNTNSYQATSGFSWRVADILGSNACLVTEKAKDLENFGIKIPQFESPTEAKEICKKLLQNENLRKDIVESAHTIINKNHRFASLPILENIAGIKLKSDGNGTINIINTDKPVIEAKQQNKEVKLEFPTIEKSKLKSINKIYYKLAKHFYKKINL